jgi:hypothetical protein
LSRDVFRSLAVDGWHAKVGKDQICTVVYKFGTEFVVGAKCDRVWGSLRPRPEWLTTRGQVVIWEESLKITDRVVVVFVKNITGLLDATGDIASFLKFNELVNVSELSAYT